MQEGLSQEDQTKAAEYVSQERMAAVTQADAQETLDILPSAEDIETSKRTFASIGERSTTMNSHSTTRAAQELLDAQLESVDEAQSEMDRTQANRKKQFEASEKHFRDHEEQYKQTAVDEAKADFQARGSGESVNYPPFTPGVSNSTEEEPAPIAGAIDTAPDARTSTDLPREQYGQNVHEGIGALNFMEKHLQGLEGDDWVAVERVKQLINRTLDQNDQNITATEAA